MFLDHDDWVKATQLPVMLLSLWYVPETREGTCMSSEMSSTTRNKIQVWVECASGPNPAYSQFDKKKKIPIWLIHLPSSGLL